MGASASPAARVSLVATATHLAETARALDEEAQRLRAENSALVDARDQLLALLTAVTSTLGPTAHRQTRRRTSTPTGHPHGADRARTVGAPVTTGSEPSGSVMLDREHRRLVVGSHAISMSPREFDLLAHLLGHLGQPLSAEALARAVWQGSFRGDLRSVRVHVSAIRAKLEQFVGLPFRITTVHRLGYRADRVDGG